MSDKAQQSNDAPKRVKKTYGDEEESYIKGLTYVMLALIFASMIMWGLSKLLDNKSSSSSGSSASAAKTTEKKEDEANKNKPVQKPQNPHQKDYAGQNFDDRYKNNPSYSKDSTEAILAKVANKILLETKDPATECSIPVFDQHKQYWITECDYVNLTTQEKARQKFSIQLDNIEKIN